MGTSTGIEWTDHTLNPWRGCEKVSPGCKHCYAETLSKRNPAVLGEWGPAGKRAMAAESHWRLPLKWNRAAERDGVRRRVFCLSLGDFAEPRAELIEPRARLFRLIGATPWLDWLLLTKRPMYALANWKVWAGYAHESRQYNLVIPNVWVGVSVEDQVAADARIPVLLAIPARVRFVSCEPLLGPLDIQHWLGSGNDDTVGWGAGIDWVIVGGESGPNRRPLNPSWAYDLYEQCLATRVPFFFKQDSASQSGQPGRFADDLAHVKEFP